MPSSQHHSVTNERATRKSAKLQKVSRVINTPDHDHTDIGISVLRIDGHLSERCRWVKQ
jgi:hypothetical protein